MAQGKRALEDPSISLARKKPKHVKESENALTASEEVDFPRGGGTNFTALEVKNIRTEALQEADDQIFAVRTRSTTCMSA